MARRELPTGTVTLLFTDIEGSTQLIEELGEEDYVGALAEHRRLLRSAFAGHGGVEVDTQGDAFLYAFADPVEALEAAARGQQALAGGLVRVRMGLHTGELRLTGEGYAGRELHRAARIATCGHGGQVVLSAATRTFLDGDVRELGEHRLKDFAEPVALFQLGRERFPPLRTISNTNLPRPASSFVGRQIERAELVRMLGGNARLVTLCGPGGSGKTRLAVEAASELVPAFAAGVFWVPLAALREPALVTETIAQTLGAKDGLAQHIGEREMLLLLDNIEQVVEAAPDLGRLLERCLNLKLMVTSRELLHIRGEVGYAVPPLAQLDAVALFCERSRLAADETIAELCRQLDDLPLAIELAAARTSVLSPAQILGRLSQRLDLLRGGRDADPRQQTLRATIEWSHDLLRVEEQRLFAQLAVFRGGCTLEAAEQVADAELGILQSLVDKSLLRHSGERFWMLETIRQFAVELLEASGDSDDLNARHARWFLAIAEEGASELNGASQAVWLARLDTEHDNLRAALAFARRTGRPLWELRLAGALWQFWYRHGLLNEGRARLEEILAAAGSELTVEHEKILNGAAFLTNTLGDHGRAEELAAQRLTISRADDNPKLIASSLFTLGVIAQSKGELDRASALGTEGVDLARKEGDTWALSVTLNMLGIVALSQGDDQTARSRYEEALALARQDSDTRNIAAVLMNLGEIAARQDQSDEAQALVREALALGHRLGDKEVVISCLDVLGELAASEGKPDRAARLLGASHALRDDTGHTALPFHQEQLERTIALLDAELDEGQVTAARAEGHAMTLDQAVTYALEPGD